MNDWKPIVVLAKLSLLLLLATVLLSVAAVIGLGYLADNLTARLAQLQAGLKDQQAQLTIQQTDLLNVRTHIQRYETLRVQGLVGDPDRALWVEQLQSNFEGLGLPGDVIVQLQAAKPLQGNGAIAPQGDASAMAEPLVHDLQFELRNSMETDVLALIQNFQAQTKGRFRVNSCRWFEPGATGFTAQCVLRFITIPLGTPVAPPATPGASQ